MKEAMYIGIDLSTLGPGSKITEETLHDLHKKNTVNDKSEFWTFCLRLKKDIENTLMNAGKPCAVRQKRGDMHVIQHQEMSEYTSKEIDKSLTRAARYDVLLNCVDMEPMTEEQKAVHVRKCYAANQQIDSLVNVRNKIGLTSGSLIAYAQLRKASELPEM